MIDFVETQRPKSSEAGEHGKATARVDSIHMPSHIAMTMESYPIWLVPVMVSPVPP